MKTYNYNYIYHKYNVFVKDGNTIQYGTAVLSRSDGTPFIVKIRNKDHQKWTEAQDTKMDYGTVKVCITYDQYGKVVLESFSIPSYESGAAFGEDGLPI